MNPQKDYIPFDRHPQAEIRRAQRVLRMVHELHKAGFHRSGTRAVGLLLAMHDHSG